MRLRHGFAIRSALVACGIALAVGVAAQPAAAADHRRGGGGGWHRSGGFHHDAFPHHHFHSFVFFGAGLGYPYAYPYYPYYPAYAPPPTYVSPTECYQPPVPRGPGVADLYTCSGQYVGAIAVP